MNKILIFESGESGYGGSFKGCYFITRILKKYGYSPNVIAVNDSIYWKKLKHHNIKVKIINHIFYSKKISGNFLDRNLKKNFSRIKYSKYYPNFQILFNSFIHFNLINHIKKFIIEKNIKLIHTNISFIRDISVYKVAIDLKLPVICHLRTMPKRHLTYREKILAGYRSSRFIAISKAVLIKWVEVGVPESKIELIYNSQLPVKVRKKTFNYKKNSIKNNSIIYLLFAGSLIKRKGINILIEALSYIESKNWKLSIIG